MKIYIALNTAGELNSRPEKNLSDRQKTDAWLQGVLNYR